MKKRWFKIKVHSISFRLFVCFFAVWLPFSIIVMGSLLIASVKLTQNTIDSREDRAAYYSAVINSDLDRIVQLLYTMCGDPSVIEFAKQRDESFEYADYLIYLNAYSKLKAYQQISMYIDDIFLLLPNTKELLTVKSSVIPLDQTMNHKIKEYQNTGTSFFVEGDNMVYLFRGANNIMMGITISVRHIKNTLKTYDNDNNYDFFLIDSKTKQLLGKSTVEKLGKDIYKQVAKSPSMPKEIKIGSKSYIMEQIHTPDNHFDIIMYSDRSILYKDVHFIQSLWTLLNVIAVCVPIIMALVITRTVNKPMQKLVTAMQKVEEEVYDYKLETDETSEFSYVFHQYNCMAAKVENLIQEVYEKQLQVQDAKFKQLQAQINPHFLFNSFYMGYRMAKAGETEKVAQLCMYLGDYFKVLTYISNDYIALEEDIKFVHTYLLLNQMRFEEKLFYEIIVDQGLDHMRIPHLFIQPLIENAIRHGVEKVSEPCHIILSIKDMGDVISISVSDDCDTISEEEIHKQRAILQQASYEKGSMGLWNIQQRLNAMGMKDQGLLLNKTKEGLFVVEFTIKKKEVQHV